MYSHDFHGRGSIPNHSSIKILSWHFIVGVDILFSHYIAKRMSWSGFLSVNKSKKWSWKTGKVARRAKLLDMWAFAYYNGVLYQEYFNGDSKDPSHILLWFLQYRTWGVFVPLLFCAFVLMFTPISISYCMCLLLSLEDLSIWRKAKEPTKFIQLGLCRIGFREFLKLNRESSGWFLIKQID